MSQPRVFISHAAHGDPSGLAFIDRLKAKLQPRFAVLVDKDDIPTGEEWRRTLNTWIGGCHAAVLLLSPRALERPWVAYEASILRFRDNCKVVSVFLKPVTYQDIQNSDLAPAAIDALQAIIADDADEIIAKVNAALDGVASLHTPIDQQRLFARFALKDIPEELARQVTDQLGFDFGDWRSNACDDLALALMSSPLKSAAKAVLQIKRYLKDEDARKDLFQIIANSWVDEGSTSALRSIARRQNDLRGVTIPHALRSLTGQCYITRATNRAPLDSWKWASISNGICSENASEALEKQVEQSLLTTLRAGSSEVLASKLRAREQMDEPVFVILPGAGLDGEIVNHLRTRFPTVTFIALAGDDENTKKVLLRSGLTTLKPELDLGFEDKFHEQYSLAEEVLF